MCRDKDDWPSDYRPFLGIAHIRQRGTVTMCNKDPDDPDDLGGRTRRAINPDDVPPWKGDYGRWNFTAAAARVARALLPRRLA